MCSIIAIAMVAFTAPTYAALNTRSTAANNATAARAQNKTGARVPTTTGTKTVTTTPSTNSTPEPVAEPEPDPEPETPIIVSNKTSMFNDVMSEIGVSDPDASNNELADAIRRQRALLDGAANQAETGGNINVSGAGVCDASLRQCMAEKCGNDFTKCANDSTTIWGQKMDSCRAKTECTGHEYSLIAPEILADRDMNVRMSHYNSVISCGNRYNNCIFTQCGTTLNKCLSKKDGDNAISKCASIANECKSMDNGLASRVMTVFGDLRKIATAQAQKDEARLNELRNLMRNQCNRFGAMFDERTLDCVYTVNFFAGADKTLMASKKLYSGDSFQCTPDWFGIDITTYIENAQRLTREQKSMVAGAMGAGVGTTVGLAASGTIGRAMKTRAAEQAVDAAQQEKYCNDASGTWDGKKCTDAKGDKIEFDEDGKPKSNSSTGVGKDQGKTEEKPCSAYSGGKDICEKGDHKKECEFVKVTGECVDKGTKEQYQTPKENDTQAEEKYCAERNLKYDTETKKCTECPDDGKHEIKDGVCTDIEMVSSATCWLNTTQSSCTGNCQWDSTANNGKGKCVPTRKEPTSKQEETTYTKPLLSDDDPGIQKISQTSHGLFNYSGANNDANQNTGNNTDLPPVNKRSDSRYSCPIYPKQCSMVAMQFGEWRLDFNDRSTSLHGISVCHKKQYTQADMQTLWIRKSDINHEITSGGECSCKLVLTSKHEASEWVSINADLDEKNSISFKSHTDCTKHCPDLCTIAMDRPTYRKKMYDTLSKY